MFKISNTLLMESSKVRTIDDEGWSIALTLESQILSKGLGRAAEAHS